MKQDIERNRVEEALAEAEAWKEEYLADGGEDTAYLDGKIAAFEELLADKVQSSKR